jgi:hypothetical protein
MTASSADRINLVKTNDMGKILPEFNKLKTSKFGRRRKIKKNGQKNRKK